MSIYSINMRDSLFHRGTNSYKQECYPVGGVPTAAVAILGEGGRLRHTPHAHLPFEQTDTCENITFPHTSYAVGNKHFHEQVKRQHSGHQDGHVTPKHYNSDHTTRFCLLVSLIQSLRTKLW